MPLGMLSSPTQAEQITRPQTTKVEIEIMSSEIAAPNRLKVDVNYNALTEALHFTEHELGHALFEHACKKFGMPRESRAELALYLPDKTTEVPPDLTAEQGGVKPDTTLILRPRGPGGGVQR